MKIKSNLSGNFMSIYSEAKGVARNKKYILKNKKVFSINYFLELAIRYIISLYIEFYYLDYTSGTIQLVFLFLILCTLVFIIFDIFRLTFMFENICKRGFVTSITVTDKGIIDESFYGIKMLFKWNKIKAVVVKNKSVVILTDTPCYFYFSSRDEKNIIKKLKEYNKNILVIRK